VYTELSLVTLTNYCLLQLLSVIDHFLANMQTFMSVECVCKTITVTSDSWDSTGNAFPVRKWWKSYLGLIAVFFIVIWWC